MFNEGAEVSSALWSPAGCFWDLHLSSLSSRCHCDSYSSEWHGLTAFHRNPCWTAEGKALAGRPLTVRCPCVPAKPQTLGTGSVLLVTPPASLIPPSEPGPRGRWSGCPGRLSPCSCPWVTLEPEVSRRLTSAQPEDDAGDPAGSEPCGQVGGTQARTRGLHSYQGWAQSH